MAIKLGATPEEIKKRAENSPNMLDSGNIAEKYAELIMGINPDIKENVGKEDVSSRISQEAEENNKVVEIELDRIQASPLNKFKAYPKEKMEELKHSIKNYGLWEPIIVRPKEFVSSYSIDKEFEIVAGHNRYTAHKELGMKKIKCAIVDYDDVTVSVMINQSNIQRDISEMEIARSYYETFKLMSNGSGGDHKSSNFKEKQKCQNGTFENETGDVLQILADKYGVGRRTMARKIQLAQLTDRVADLYERKKITQAQAIDISYAPEDMQEAFVDNYYQSVDKHCITDEMTKAFSQKAKELKKQNKTMAPNDIVEAVSPIRKEALSKLGKPKPAKEIKISIPESAFPSELKKQDRSVWVLNAIEYIKSNNITFNISEEVEVQNGKNS